MTRLEAGPLQPSSALADLSDVVGAALQRAGKILGAHRVEVDLEPELPMLRIDMVLMEQVLFNLLDNAAKYAPAGPWSGSAPGAKRGGQAAHPRRGQRHSGERPRTDLRQVLPGARSRPPARRDGPWACDLPRLRRGHGWHDRRGKPSGPARGRVHHQPACAGQSNPAVPEGRSSMTGAGPLRILVVDDEPAILRFLRTGLSAQGYLVSEAQDGRAALDTLRRNAVDMVILDLGLPDMDGLEVIRRMRGAGSRVPIIVLSSRDDESGKVEALDLGADDYVTKPFGIDELFARVRAAQRHRLQEQGERPLFRSGDLVVDLVRRVVTVRGAEMKFAPREYDLLRLLVAHAGKVLTHRFILHEVWGVETDVQYLRIYIRALRQKIEADPERPAHILTETGVGYRLRAPD